MTLCLFVLFAWIVLTVFTKIPKRISYLDILFLFCLSLVLTTETFSILDVNLHWVVISRNVEKSFAVITHRVIAIPLLLVMSVNAIHSSLRWYTKLFAVVGILATLLSSHLLLTRTGVATMPHWKFIYSFLMYTSFVLLINLFAWWFVRLGGRKVAEN